VSTNNSILPFELVPYVGPPMTEFLIASGIRSLQPADRVRSATEVVHLRRRSPFELVNLEHAVVEGNLRRACCEDSHSSRQPTMWMR
jgi:hypothetical protein